METEYSGENVGKRNPYIVLMIIKISPALWEYGKKLKLELSYDLFLTFLGIQRRNQNPQTRDTDKPIFIVV